MKRLPLFLMLLVSLGGCTVPQAVINIPMDRSLGLEVFEGMKEIERHHARIGLYIDPNLKTLVLSPRQGNILLNLNVGEIFSVKLIKVLAYKFDRVRLLDRKVFPEGEALDAILHVELKDADVSLKYTAGSGTTGRTSQAWLEVKATMSSKAGVVIWVGISKAEGISTEAPYGGYFPWRDWASGMELAIERAIGQLMKQMRESDNLRRHLEKQDIN